ncbi:MAG TPA: pitrilysin family protein [Phycisphaerae bacterium]|nr:pitrilysin family protein [Phycisphaerae bacterium]
MRRKPRKRALRESYRTHDAADRRVAAFDNGLTAIIQRHDVAPVVEVRVYVRGGSAFEGRWTGTGISHLLEHVITSDGTERRDEREVARLGERLGGLINAYTTIDHICHHVSTTRENMSTAVEVFSDYLIRPLLSEAVFDREMGVVQRELERDRDEPETQLEEMFYELAYVGHPLQYPVIGHRSGLLSLTHTDILAYHRQLHVPDNVFVVIVGDVDLDEATAAVAQHFDGMERRARYDMVLPPVRPFAAPIRAIKAMNVESATMTLGWLTVRDGQPDDIALDLLSTVLGQSDHSRLAKLLKWERQLAFEVGVMHDSLWHSTGTMQIDVQCDASKVEALERAIMEMLAGLEQSPVTAAELDRARRQNLTSLRLQRETASGAATQVGEDFLASGNVDYARAYESLVNETTTDDLMRAAKRYLRPGLFASAAILPKRRVMRRSGTAPSISINAPKIVTLDNGLTCVLRPMQGCAFASAYISFIGGILLENEETNGIHPLLMQVLTRGTTTRSADEIAEAFASRGSALGAGAGLNQVSASYTAQAEDFHSLFEVLADVILSSSFDAAELAKLRPSLCDNIVREEEDWNAELIHFARRKFFEHSPYRMPRLGTLQNAKRFTREDLIAAQRSLLFGGNGVLSIAGKIDPDAMEALVRRCFAALPPGTDRLYPIVSPEPRHTDDRLFIKRSSDEREVAGLFIGFPGLTVSDHEHRAAVTVLETMLGGYALSGGRLFAALRGGDRDMVYEIAPAGLIGLLPGYIAFVAGCEPERINEVYRLVKDELDAVRSARFDAEEVERARSMVIMGELDQLQSASEYAARTGLDELFGLGVADAERFLADIRAVTPDEIRAAASTYLGPSTVVVVTPHPDLVDFGLTPIIEAAAVVADAPP